MAVVVEYHEHLPAADLVDGREVWRCQYTHLDGTQCDDTEAAPGRAASRTMTRDAVDDWIDTLKGV